MKVSVLQEALLDALKSATRNLDSKPALPVLANVLLDASGSQLRLVGTNLETTTEVIIGATVQEPGQVTLPVKTLIELVSNLEHERVDIGVTPMHTATIRCGTTKSTMHGISALEFPALKDFEARRCLIPAKQLAEALKHVLWATASEDSRPILTGVCLTFDDTTLTLAGSNGYCLATQQIPIDRVFDKRTQLVIPVTSLKTLLKTITKDSTDILVDLDENNERIAFHDSRVTITSQLLNGRYPDFASIIPKHHSTSATLYVEDFVKALKRARTFAKDSNYSVRLKIENDLMQVEGKSAERGDAGVDLDMVFEGDSLYAAYNVQYMLDAIGSFTEERVVFETGGASHPGVLYPEGRSDVLAIVMPMSINR